MIKLFEEFDKTGRLIYLTNERWKHIVMHHPDLCNGFEDIKDIIVNATIIKRDLDETDLHYYYKYVKDKKRYMLVLVKYLNGEGFIITSFYTRNIK